MQITTNQDIEAAFWGFCEKNSDTIALIQKNHGPTAPFAGEGKRTDTCVSDLDVIARWLAAVSLLAHGAERGCHNGGTLDARIKFAKELMAAWKTSGLSDMLLPDFDGEIA